MPIFKETNVLVKDGFLVRDGITRPEPNDSGKNRWNLKFVVPPNHPDGVLVQQLAQMTLNESEFKGVLPNGGRLPVGVASATEFNGMFPGWSVINATTYKSPVVHEEGTGRIMDPMEFAPLLYGGQRVDVVVSCNAYNNLGKGIACTLQGFSPIVSAGAQRIEFGEGGVDASSAFGAGVGGGMPGGPPGGGGGPGPQHSPVQPQPGAPAGPGPGQGAGAAPQPVHNFLPGQGGPTPPGPGPTPPGPTTEPTYVAEGQRYTRAQLHGYNFTDAQIDALPTA